MHKKTIHIQGMHCTSCEILLEDELGNIKRVEKVRADRKNNLVEISYSGQEPDMDEITRLVEKFGYKVSEEKESGKKDEMGHGTDWLKAFGVVVILFVIFRIFQNLGIADNINVQSSGVNYLMAILIGVVASVSSCLAIVGSVVIVFSEKYKTGGDSFMEGVIKPNVSFQIGRLATFFILGGVLGFLGGEINITGNFISVYTIIIAVVMAILGLNILGILPSLSNLGIVMPKRVAGRWGQLKRSNHKMAPFLLGGLSFFLPCGFTQSMQILALASGSFLSGSLLLFFFALGTVPSLLALGVTASWTKNKKMAVFQKVAGMMIVIFAVYTFNSGLALGGVKTNVVSSSQKDSQVQAKKVEPVDQSDVQVVEMHVTSSGFQPDVLRIKKDIPVRWVIYGDNVSGCTNKIIVPSLNIEKNISSGKNIIEFTPQKSGDMPFSCWMGMVRGKFIVE